MFNTRLKQKYPFVTGFFEAASVNKMAHSFLFTGSDTVGQYQLATGIAKILNCENGSGSPECNCLSCSWIKQNRHPAVITVSPIDYISAKDGKSLTVISMEQARYLRNELLATSKYHRVIIFTDAAEGVECQKTYDEAVNDYSHDMFPPPQGQSSDEERIWIPKPLTYKVFQTSAANALLKTVEEPGENITFFFLTKDKEDMIATIVSRCQVISVASVKKPSINETVLNQFANIFPIKSELEAILAAEKFIELSKNENITMDEMLNSIQEYLRQMVNANLSNSLVLAKLIKLINKIEQTKSEIINYVNINASMELLFLELAKTL